jgi:hypothetical protein
MPIENRNLTVGTKLIGKYHKQDYHCELVEGEDKKLKFRLEDGREFKSPSGAGMAVTGHACDGWKFWSVETTETAPTVTAPKETLPEQPAENTATPQTSASPKRRIIFRAPNQKGIPSGQTRWYCKDCSQSFLVEMGTIPDTCPQGHKS